MITLTVFLQVAIDSFERGSISYADAKLELYRVKMEILNHKFDPEKSYLLSLNLAQVQRIEEIKQSWRRTCKDNGHKGTKGNEAEESESPRKQKRKLDKPRKVAKPRLLSEEANQDDHIGLPVSPTAVSPGQRIQDMPGVLGPFTLLLQVNTFQS